MRWLTGIVGYTYRADQYHGRCLVEEMIARRDLSPAALDMVTEEVLDQHAGALAIDREDEVTFDSDDFPKVILDQQIDGEEYCGRCGHELR